LWVAGLLVVLVVLAVYGRTVQFRLLSIDDSSNISLNPYLNPPSWRNLGYFWRQPYLSLYIPLAYTLWSAEGLLAWPQGHLATPGVAVDFDPRVFHAGSIALHCLAALGSLLVLSRLVGRATAAAAGALLFALHPMQVESVGWVTENKGLLSALFSLLALWQYLRFAEASLEPGAPRPDRPRSRQAAGLTGRWHYGLATAFFALALLSKPSAAGLPLVAGALDWLIVRRPWQRVLTSAALWLIMAAAVLWLTRSEQSGSTITFASPLWARPLVAGDTIAFYVVKLFVPWPLGPDYGRSLPVLLRQPTLWFAWLLPAAAAGLLLWMAGRRRALALMATFLASLLGVLGLVPFAYQSISTVADRYVYLAMLAPALGLAWFVDRPRNSLVLAAVAAGLCLLAVVSFRQTAVWRDDASWVRQAMRITPHSVYAHENLAQTLEKKGQVAAAIAQRQLSARENPFSLEALFNLATAYNKQRRIEEAADCYRRAIAIYPGSNIARAFLAESLVRLNRPREALAQFRQAAQSVRGDRNFAAQCTRIARELIERGRDAEAYEVLQTALRIRPDSIEALNNLAALAARHGNAQAAIAYLDRALAIDRRHVPTLINRGSLFVSLGQTDRGFYELRRALAIAPRDFAAQSTLATALLRSGRAAEALSAHRIALALNPNWLPGQLNLAWVLATASDDTCRDGGEALQLAERLCERTKFSNPGALDALAAAQAETRDFAAAVATAQQAATIARQQKQEQQAAAIEQRLALYRAQRPFREPPGASLFAQ
jgi:tetratricopeptide (TPR) repeat protein